MSQDFGLDRSGNTNHWAVNNMTYSDQMVDSPTNNFCTFNPLQHDDAMTYSEGNLKLTTPNYPFATGTFFVDSGKWYWEWVGVAGTMPTYSGICNKDRVPGGENHTVANVQSWVGNSEGQRKDWTASSRDDSLGDITAGSIMSVRLDLDGGSIKYYENNSLIHTDSTLPAGELVTPMCMATNDGSSGADWMDEVFNFGQDSSFAGNKTAQGNQDSNDIGDFYYTPPTDFLALCTSNLPAVAVVPSAAFNTILYTGTGGARTQTGVGFQPDLAWVKQRSGGQAHLLFDAVRGNDNYLSSSSDNDEASDIGNFDLASDGFTIGTDSAYNANTETYVAWNWLAGNATLGTGDFTQGSIASTCSRNVDAGFSIVSYTGTGSAGNIGHGLSSAPELMIVKNRSKSAGESWVVYHASNTAAPETEKLLLNTNAATSDSADPWNDTAPTSTLFSVNADDSTNDSSETFIAYCFHSVDGFSKFGSYTGNGSLDGTFVYTGFRPAWIMIKRTNTTPGDWRMIDSARNSYNGQYATLTANGNAEDWFGDTDFGNSDLVANGFKIRNTYSQVNYTASTYMYMAFAEIPFKYSNAR